MRLRVLLCACPLIAALALAGLVPAPSAGRTLQERIDAAQEHLNKVRRHEGVLSGDVAAASRRIEVLQREVTELRRRQDALQSDLDGKRTKLNRLQDDLREARARLADLRARLTVSRRVLGARLAAVYKAERPDFLTVILDSNGFADLLERSEFLERINDQDLRVIRTVRDARDESQRVSSRLARIEERQQAITTAVLVRRNQVASVRLRVVDKQREYGRARAAKAAVLSRVRSERHGVEEDLAAMEREQARIRGVLTTGPQPAGPIRRGSGSFIWPVNGPITGSFGENRGTHMHAGIDISAPTGTPIRAVAGGRVVLAGWTGGYGNYTCILHGGGLSSCYAHQSRYATSSGASVSQGQVIGYVGSTGNSTGPHLHFEIRSGGSPVNPLSYL